MGIFEIIILGLIWDKSKCCLASTLLENDHYTGAVVEFSPELWDGSEQPKYLLVRNSRKISKIIEEAGKEKADILVTPECGITGLRLPATRDKLKLFASFLPAVKDEVIPCDEINNEMLSEHLKELSCSAKINNIYVVINLLEKVHCDKAKSDCPFDGILMYNTNIVFDRTGKLIAKYHKYNLFIEPETNTTSKAELITFDTDFGVKFGTFICFDILFKEPAIEILEKTEVKNIVYSTAWFSELPFLTAVEVQAGYSYSQNINLLASGFDLPDNKNFGSGIYAGKNGPLVMIMPDKPTTKLLVAKIPRNPNFIKNNDECTIRNEPVCSKQYVPSVKIIEINFNDDYYELKDNNIGREFYHEDFSKFTTELLDENININEIENMEITKKKEFSYNNDGFKCTIAIKWNINKNENQLNNIPVYRFVGYSGTRSYVGLRTVKIEVCGIVACKNSDISSCGYTPNFSDKTLVNISSILINTETEFTSNPFVMTLDKNMLALRGNDVKFIYNTDGKTNLQTTSLSLITPHNDLIAFGIYKT